MLKLLLVNTFCLTAVLAMAWALSWALSLAPFWTPFWPAADIADSGTYMLSPQPDPTITTATTTVSELQPDSRSVQNWHFDFEPIEKALVKIQFDASQHLLLDSNAEQALLEAVTAFPTPLSQRTLHRIAFLTQQTVPADAGNALSGLLMQYYRYQQQVKKLRAGAASSKEGLSSGQAQTARVTLQRQIFGMETAQALFGQQRAIANYTLQRLQILHNAELTLDQKQARALALQQQYQQQISQPVKPAW